MTRWTRHPFYPTKAMEHSVVQWNVRGFQADFEEFALLSRRYRPAVFGLQETLLTYSKSPSFSGFRILTKYSLNDRATGGVVLLINNSYLFNEVHFNTFLQTGNVEQSHHLLHYLSSSVRSHCQEGSD